MDWMMGWENSRGNKSVDICKIFVPSPWLIGTPDPPDVRKFSFPVRVVGSWNRLPDNVKTTTSKDAFKRMLRQQQAAH